MKLIITESQLKKIVKSKVTKSINEDIGESTNKVTLVGVETPDDLNVDFDYDVVKIFSNRNAAREYASYLEKTQSNGSVFMREFDVLNSFSMGEKPSYDIPGFEGTMDKLNSLSLREGWRDIFGEPDIKDAARSAYKSQGHSMMGRDDEQRSGEYYMVFNGEKFFPDQIEYADYQDLGDLPRVEDGKLIVPNPAWQS